MVSNHKATVAAGKRIIENYNAGAKARSDYKNAKAMSDLYTRNADAKFNSLSKFELSQRNSSTIASIGAMRDRSKKYASIANKAIGR